MNEIEEDSPIWKAIDRGGGQSCDVRGVILGLYEAGYRIVKQPEQNEALRPGFSERSYELGYMDGENSAIADLIIGADAGELNR